MSFRASLDAAASERVALDELLGIFVSEVQRALVEDVVQSARVAEVGGKMSIKRQ